MNTPVCDFVSSYRASNPLRLHMPGHKGIPLLGMEPLDITEIPGADELYHADGILLESENNASSLFGTRRTFYSTEGSSLPIRAMLYLICLHAARQGRQPQIAAGRNAHKVFITAAALLNIRVDWLYPETQKDLISCEITPSQLDAFLGSSDVDAVYLTSPDYLGNMADISGIAQVCRAHGCLLLVDNAHGAYLRFLPESLHPMDFGADLCCDSAHKTLPALTGGAYLHISSGAPAEFAEEAEQALALFASTSPSYLILQSLDRVNRYLAEGYSARLASAVTDWSRVKRILRESGFCLAGAEPLKLTILPKMRGYTGCELAELLERENIWCEFFDPDHLVLMLPVDYPEELPQHLLDALLSLPVREPIAEIPPALARGVAVLTPHEALMCPSCQILTGQALGRVMASPTVSCPPAIPIVACGERIDAWAVEAMKYYGIEKIRVVAD